MPPSALPGHFARRDRDLELFAMVMAILLLWLAHIMNDQIPENLIVEEEEEDEMAHEEEEYHGSYLKNVGDKRKRGNSGDDSSESGSIIRSEAEELPQTPNSGRQCSRSKKSRKGLKKGENVGVPTKPGSETSKYITSHYETYDWNRDAGLSIPAVKFKGSFSIYNNYKLLTGVPVNFDPKDFDFSQIPRNSVRLDDEWIGFVAMNGNFKKKDLAAYWPGEFDAQGMVRARRVPLGRPCLIWAEKGLKDMDGIKVEVSGAYYAWYDGLQLLCGDEGYQADRFMVRPSHEQARKGLSFKFDYKSKNGTKNDCQYEAPEAET